MFLPRIYSYSFGGVMFIFYGKNFILRSSDNTLNEKLFAFYKVPELLTKK